jgi:peptide/nickel transport system substrate-binding protein
VRFFGKIFLGQIFWVSVVFALSLAALSGRSADAQDWLRSTAEAGRPGGTLAFAERAEPKTLNPATAQDRPSRDVIRCISGDLIHINRYTQQTEPALAKSWTISPDGKRFTLQLRRGIRFSDGSPFDADDVVFSFKVYLDGKVLSPQRDLLIVSGQPMSVEKLNSYSVRFTFAAPYATAERVFDSLAMLPRHLLEKDYAEGKIKQAWNLNVTPDKIAGLGAFRFKHFVPGERLVLERNPYYWKVDAKGQKLPYLDELTFLFVSSQDAEALRFQAGDTQIIGGLSAENFAVLSKDLQSRHYKLQDAGPGLEYHFLVFNLNDDTEGRLPQVAHRQKWFHDLRFRQAVSIAIDRAAIVRLVYQGRGAALASQVTPGNKLWTNPAVHVPEYSIPKARELLRAAGFSWDKDGNLVDTEQQPVQFTILVSSSNVQRTQMATLIQDDLKRLGMKAQAVSLEFRAATDRVVQSHDFDVALMGLAGGDVDPTAGMNVWMSSGQTHLWHLGEKQPATPWEAEIDQLMQKQLVTMDHQQRKKLYDRVQEIIAAELPVICLASPHLLAGAQQDLGNFRPAIIEPYVLWNADELFWRVPAGHL